MIKERATVIAIDNNEITLTSQIKSSCSGCAQVKTCGSGQIAKALPQAKLTVTLLYDELANSDMKVGDCVIIGLPEKHVLSSAGQVYLFPLVGLILLSGLGQYLFKQQILTHELFALALGISGGYLGYRIAKYKQKNSRSSEKLQPKIIEVLPSTSIEVSMSSD